MSINITKIKEKKRGKTHGNKTMPNKPIQITFVQVLGFLVKCIASLPNDVCFITSHLVTIQNIANYQTETIPTLPEAVNQSGNKMERASVLQK